MGRFTKPRPQGAVRGAPYGRIAGLGRRSGFSGDDRCSQDRALSLQLNCNAAFSSVILLDFHPSSWYHTPQICPRRPYASTGIELLRTPTSVKEDAAFSGTLSDYFRCRLSSGTLRDRTS